MKLSQDSSMSFRCLGSFQGYPLAQGAPGGQLRGIIGSFISALDHKVTTVRVSEPGAENGEFGSLYHLFTSPNIWLLLWVPTMVILN